MTAEAEGTHVSGDLYITIEHTMRREPVLQTTSTFTILASPLLEQYTRFPFFFSPGNEYMNFVLARNREMTGVGTEASACYPRTVGSAYGDAAGNLFRYSGADPATDRRPSQPLLQIVLDGLY